MNLKVCEVVQQLEYIQVDKIEEILKSKKDVKEYAYIVHDKDVDENGELKKAHVHIAIRFHNGSDSKHIAQWFNIKEQYINKAKGGFISLLKYLTHSNAKDKFQYDNSEVVANFDFVKFIEENGNKKGRPKKGDDVRKKQIIDDIVNGIIREYNYYNYITAHEYCEYKTAINDSFKYRIDKLLNGGSRDMEVVFITGKSGTGKTTYAKKICEDKGYSYAISSSTNDIMDSYKGQDVLILDDLRPTSLELVDLLKLLDNNTGSTVKSRYKNKFLECKMVIITTVLEIEHFYCDIKGSEFEPIEQFKRRCKTYVRLDEDNMYIRAFDTLIMDYSKIYKLKNPVWEYISVSRRTENEMLLDMANVLGITDDLIIK